MPDWWFYNSNFSFATHLSECIQLCFIVLSFVSLHLARIYLASNLDKQPRNYYFQPCENMKCIQNGQRIWKKPFDQDENQQQTRSNSVRCLGLIVTAVQNCTNTEHCSIRETSVGFFSSVLLVQEELHIKRNGCLLCLFSCYTRAL